MFVSSHFFCYKAIICLLTPHVYMQQYNEIRTTYIKHIHVHPFIEWIIRDIKQIQTIQLLQSIAKT